MGVVLLSSAHDSDGRKLKLNVADRAFFQKQIDNQVDRLDVGAPFESRITGKWVIPLSRRITGAAGAFGGLLTVTFDPFLFSEPYAKTSLGANATRALIGLDGFTRLRLNNGRIEFGGDVRKSQLFKEIKQSRAGTYTAIASSDGIQRMVIYRAIDPYGVVILAGSSIDSIETSYYEKVRGYLIGASLLGIMIVLLSGLLILGIVRQKKRFESQQSFNRLIELIPQLVTKLDAQGNIIWVNNRTVEYVGPSAEEQAGGFDWVVAAIHLEDQGHVKAFISSALLLHQNAESCEYRKRRFDGAYLWFSAQITPVLDNDDASAAFLRTGTDIHDRKMGEERARVTQKLESIGQLTGGMAHDFNNLLAIILGNLDLLKPDVGVGAPAKRLDIAISAAQRGVGLVKSLLALASKQPLLPATLDLGALAERISPLLKHAVGQRVNFVVKPLRGVVLVEVDEAGLESVLLNLIVNARDAMPKGGDLSLSLGVMDGMARIAITDNGTGMPEAVLKRATEPFFTTKERGHGTGLGLSMVAGFVNQSGGSMKIQSTQSKGTTIEMFLPLVRASNAANIALPPLAPVTAPAPLAAATSKRKILIVDDEPELADLVRAWARDQGHTAVTANSADDALTLLAVRAFDVIFTDIMMPGQMDGIGLAERASVLYPAMKINLMSGYSKATATNRADVPWPLLVKPFGKEDFYEAIERAFGDSEFTALV